jgi:hypothetical protein
VNDTLPESQGAEALRLQEESRSARKRFQRAKAGAYKPGVTNEALLAELKRASEMAENRLRRRNPAAQQSGDPHTAGRG